MTVTMPPAIDAWIVMMETTQLPQGRGSFHDPVKGSYCALGLFCIANGASPETDDVIGIGNWHFVHQHLSDEATADVFSRNDKHHMTFREIARWARDYFKNPATWASGLD